MGRINALINCSLNPIELTHVANSLPKIEAKMFVKLISKFLVPQTGEAHQNDIRMTQTAISLLLMATSCVYHRIEQTNYQIRKKDSKNKPMFSIGWLTKQIEVLEVTRAGIGLLLASVIANSRVPMGYMKSRNAYFPGMRLPLNWTILDGKNDSSMLVLLKVISDPIFSNELKTLFSAVVTRVNRDRNYSFSNLGKLIAKNLLGARTDPIVELDAGIKHFLDPKIKFLDHELNLDYKFGCLAHFLVELKNKFNDGEKNRIYVKQQRNGVVIAIKEYLLNELKDLYPYNKTEEIKRIEALFGKFTQQKGLNDIEFKDIISSDRKKQKQFYVQFIRQLTFKELISIFLVEGKGIDELFGELGQEYKDLKLSEIGESLIYRNNAEKYQEMIEVAIQNPFATFTLDRQAIGTGNAEENRGIAWLILNKYGYGANNAERFNQVDILRMICLFAKNIFDSNNFSSQLLGNITESFVPKELRSSFPSGKMLEKEYKASGEKIVMNIQAIIHLMLNSGQRLELSVNELMKLTPYRLPLRVSSIFSSAMSEYFIRNKYRSDGEKNRVRNRDDLLLGVNLLNSIKYYRKSEYLEVALNIEKLVKWLDGGNYEPLVDGDKLMSDPDKIIKIIDMKIRKEYSNDKKLLGKLKETREMIKIYFEEQRGNFQGSDLNRIYTLPFIHNI